MMLSLYQCSVTRVIVKLYSHAPKLIKVCMRFTKMHTKTFYGERNQRVKQFSPFMLDLLL